MTRYFNTFEFQVCFLTRSREELLFYLSKMILCLRLTQCYLKIILSNRQCVLLLHDDSGRIYVKNAKHAEHVETGNFQRKNKSNNQRPQNFEKSKSGKVYPAIQRSGCRVLLRALR